MSYPVQHASSFNPSGRPVQQTMHLPPPGRSSIISTSTVQMVNFNDGSRNMASATGHPFASAAGGKAHMPFVAQLDSKKSAWGNELPDDGHTVSKQTDSKQEPKQVPTIQNSQALAVTEASKKPAPPTSTNQTSSPFSSVGSVEEAHCCCVVTSHTSPGSVASCCKALAKCPGATVDCAVGCLTGLGNGVCRILDGVGTVLKGIKEVVTCSCGGNGCCACGTVADVGGAIGSGSGGGDCDGCCDCGDCGDCG